MRLIVELVSCSFLVPPSLGFLPRGRGWISRSDLGGKMWGSFFILIFHFFYLCRWKVCFVLKWYFDSDFCFFSDQRIITCWALH